MRTLIQSAWKYPYDTYDVLYLENHTRGHNKFYEMKKIANSQWEARWGKIGTNGHTQNYHANCWIDKIREKLKKGYVLERATSTSSAGIPSGSPPPLVNPHKPDSDILTDAVTMRKLDRISLFLNDKGKDNECSLVDNIKLEYIRTGVLTKDDMEKLNKFWTKNGGSHWVE